MATQTKSVDLTLPFIVWLVVWSLVGFALDWPMWVVVTAIFPLIFWFTFVFAVMGFAVLVMIGVYAAGKPIKLTRGDKVKYIQRGKKRS